MDINTLVISGGGLKGIAFIGALSQLNIEKVENYCGSSVGALICAGIVLGYSIEEMRVEIMRMSEMMERIIPFMFNKKTEYKILPLILNYMSLTDGKIFDEYLKEFFVKKECEDITFKELFKKTNKNLVISGSNLTTCKPEYFSYSKTPNMSVYDAIRISSRIPYIFPVMKYNDNIYVDGDVFDSFPIKGVKKILRKNILGIVTTMSEKSHKINNIIDLSYGILRGVTHRYNKMIHKKYKKNIIKIECDIGFGINLSHQELHDLYIKGQHVTQKHFTPFPHSSLQKKSLEVPSLDDKEGCQEKSPLPD